MVVAFGGLSELSLLPSSFPPLSMCLTVSFLSSNQQCHRLTVALKGSLPRRCRNFTQFHAGVLLVVLMVAEVNVVMAV